MKLHAPVTSAFLTAALAAGSISLAILLLPAGGTPARSSGVAPALKLVAGDVVAAVQIPIRAVEKSHSKPAASHPLRVVTQTPVSTRSRTASAPIPAQPAREPRSHGRAPRAHATVPTLVTTQAAAQPAPTPSLAGHDHGQGNAWGRSGHGTKVHGRSADAPHGPPAVPPGHARDKGSDGHGASGHRGGGE